MRKSVVIATLIGVVLFCCLVILSPQALGTHRYGERVLVNPQGTYGQIVGHKPCGDRSTSLCYEVRPEVDPDHIILTEEKNLVTVRPPLRSYYPNRPITIDEIPIYNPK